MQKEKRINKKYSPEYKINVILDMINNHLGYNETKRKYGITGNITLQLWERRYLEEGVEGLMKERRGRIIKIGRPKELDEKVEEDLIAENQRLRMENEYLKKLHALVQERIQRENQNKQK